MDSAVMLHSGDLGFVLNTARLKSKSKSKSRRTGKQVGFNDSILANPTSHGHQYLGGPHDILLATSDSVFDASSPMSSSSSHTHTCTRLGAQEGARAAGARRSAGTGTGTRST